MKKAIYIFLMVVSASGSTTGFSENVNELDLKELRKKADSILKQSDVSARRDIDVVFELADRLLKEKNKDSEYYLEQGLKHFPWNLEHQMIYAELLAKEDKPVQAREKADLVLQYAETDDLIERARKLLGKESFPTFDKIKSLSGSNDCVVLVPVKEADKWLLLRIKEQLSTILNIPVYIQTIEVKYPTFERDRRKLILNQIRRRIKENLDDPSITKALKDMNMTQKDLDDEAKLLGIFKTLMSSAGPREIAEFEASLEQSRGKDQQWNADQLLDVLISAVNPHRRKNVAYLGVTFADIYANDYNFLFGWANSKGGVMSYRRFTADFTGETPSQDRLLKRTLMQCLSSIGHIYGLERCSDPTCARAYPNSLSEHDAKQGTLCSHCKMGFKKIFEPSPRGDSQKAAPQQ